MFGSHILETAIGLILVFLVLSLICSAMREGIEAVLKHRALDLEHGIRELLHDPEGKGLAHQLYTHPLVFGTFQGSYEATPKRRWLAYGGRLPSYIPSTNFARALIDLDQQGKINSPAFKEVLRSLAHEAGDDVTMLRKNLETWFDSAAERIGGWYKRRTQIILLGLGLASAAVLNINAIAIADSIFHSAELRTAVVASAESFVASNQAGIENSATSSYQSSMRELHNLAAVGLPMGWGEGRPTTAIHIMIFGWLITALAVTLGAPFWFDLLNRIVSIRSTLKPKPADPAKQPAIEASVPAAAEPRVVNTQIAARKAVRQGDVVATPIPVPHVVRESFQPHEWANDDVEEGVL